MIDQNDGKEDLKDEEIDSLFNAKPLPNPAMTVKEVRTKTKFPRHRRSDVFLRREKNREEPSEHSPTEGDVTFSPTWSMRGGPQAALSGVVTRPERHGLVRP